MDSDDDLPPLEIVGKRRVQTDRATAADVPPEPATDADVPLAFSLLRCFLVGQPKAMVATAVIHTMPVVSAKGSKSALIDRLVEYVERGGRDTYCAVMQPFKKRCLAEWLAVNSSPKLNVNSTKDGVVVAFMRRDGVADIRHTPRQTASSSHEQVLQIVLADGDRLRKKLEKKWWRGAKKLGRKTWRTQMSRQIDIALKDILEKKQYSHVVWSAYSESGNRAPSWCLVAWLGSCASLADALPESGNRRLGGHISILSNLLLVTGFLNFVRFKLKEYRVMRDVLEPCLAYASCEKVSSPGLTRTISRFRMFCVLPVNNSILGIPILQICRSHRREDSESPPPHPCIFEPPGCRDRAQTFVARPVDPRSFVCLGSPNSPCLFGARLL